MKKRCIKVCRRESNGGSGVDKIWGKRRGSKLWGILRTKVKDKEIPQLENSAEEVSQVINEEIGKDPREIRMVKVMDGNQMKKKKNEKLEEKEEEGEFGDRAKNEEDNEDEGKEQEIVREDDLQEINDMSLLLSQQTSERKTARRLALSERNRTERTLVKKTVENMLIINSLKM